ncbi:DUF2868 domain-containing protein [Marinobacter pelagius]|uniref:DUF2868 domain-containing protein n=1 Tax=Marinobacter sp. C7 TaxID=2951363 RepID=UPI001EF0EFD4|nr:DUF2868 domain-containing protein [Marinobacter sp. C7]MCG7200382.1 DUF2868 domain-containing protein [Marinobacter sp. C7]
MSQNPLRLLLDFDDRIQRDRDQPSAFLHRRDRRFALDCEQQGIRPDAARWLAHMDRLSGPGATATAGGLELRFWRRVMSGFVAVGTLTGALSMLGLLFYEGGQRINITVILAFVLLQLILALATTAQSMIGWQPWRWLLRRLHRDHASPTRARLQPLFMARAAHAGGTAFALAGLATLLVMVVVQDLAFGWSTTLNTASAGYHSLVTTVAMPWAWFWPGAVPSLELVEATRFFRAAPGTSGADPARWGQWWPFVVMLWITWTLLPRVFLLALSQVLLRHRAGRLLARHPGMQALLYRMETATLDTGSGHNDAGDLPDTRTWVRPDTLPDTALMICWAGAGEPELPQRLQGPDTRTFRAGGRASLARDDEVIAQVAGELAGYKNPAVIVVTRSWEPPTGELHDFLESARECWPSGTRVALLPLAHDPNRLPQPHLVQPWLRFTERLPDGFASVALPPTDQPGPYLAGSVQQ